MNVLTLRTFGSTAMAQQHGQHIVQVSERLQKKLDVIGAWLRQQPYAPHALERQTIKRGVQYTLPAVIQPPVAYWAKRIEQGEQLSLDVLKDYALEYVRLNMIDPSRRQPIWLTGARLTAFDAQLAVIRGYLSPFTDEIPILGRKSKAQHTPGSTLVITMAIAKMVDDIEHHPQRLT